MTLHIYGNAEFFAGDSRLPDPLRPDGQQFMVATSGRSTAISTKASARPTGSPEASSQRRTFAAYLDMLLAAGFTLSRIVEWGPSLDQGAERPDRAAERQRPMFLSVSARKTARTQKD